MGGVCVDPRLPCLLWLGLPARAYAYTADLLTLAARRASRPVVPEPAVSGWDHVQSPMSADVWEEHLHDHPDRPIVPIWLMGSGMASVLASGMGRETAGVLFPICSLLWLTRRW